MRLAAPLHDVGKISIAEQILCKPGALTDDERRTIETHSEAGYRILAGSQSILLQIAARIALTHHERFDGNGYPRGLGGTDIPLEGRIAAIADVFDALTSVRPYRAALSVDEAVRIMLEGHGAHFDPDLLDRFIGALPRVIALRQSAFAETDLPDQRRVA